MKTFFFMVLLVLLNACSDGGESTHGTADSEHVWSEKVNTIDKAVGVQDILDEAGDMQRENIERQSQ